MTYDELGALTRGLATWAKASESLNRFCRGKHRMCVPIQPDDDDLVISEMLKRGQAAEAERDTLAARLAALETAGDALEDATMAVILESDSCPICMIVMDGVDDHADNCPWPSMVDARAAWRTARGAGNA